MEAAASAYGFVPNLAGVMATSPALTEAYLTLADIFEKKTGLTAAEQQVVLLAVSRYHACRYCMAAHSVIADMYKVPTAPVRITEPGSRAFDIGKLACARHPEDRRKVQSQGQRTKVIEAAGGIQ
jgi:AhpD family alkylhydroperoxidase